VVELFVEAEQFVVSEFFNVKVVEDFFCIEVVDEFFNSEVVTTVVDEYSNIRGGGRVLQRQGGGRGVRVRRDQAARLFAPLSAANCSSRLQDSRSQSLYIYLNETFPLSSCS